MKTDKEPDFFVFDRFRLEVELENHVRLYHQYATILADVRQDHERAKAQREVVAAEVAQEVRKNPEAFGLVKAQPKEAVEEAVLLDPRYRKALSKEITAKHAVDMAQAAVSTLEHRKTAISKEVDLFLSGYWAKPRVSTDAAREHMDEHRRNEAVTAFQSKHRRERNTDE